MENLWKLLEKALGMDELHNLASEARDELAGLKNRVEALEKELGGDHYEPQEYPKMLPDGQLVYSASEEAKATGAPVVEESETPPAGEVQS